MCKEDLSADAKLTFTCVDLLPSFPWMDGKFAWSLSQHLTALQEVHSSLTLLTVDSQELENGL